MGSRWLTRRWPPTRTVGPARIQAVQMRRKKTSSKPSSSSGPLSVQKQNLRSAEKPSVILSLGVRAAVIICRPRTCSSYKLGMCLINTFCHEPCVLFTKIQKFKFKKKKKKKKKIQKKKKKKKKKS